jgi:hypothetical protein
VVKDDRFKALNSGLNPGQFIMAEEDYRNINKMHNIRLPVTFKGLHLGVLYRLSEIYNSLGLSIINPEKP